MGRILAIDYGLKRTGLAVTDPLQIIATPLSVVETARLIAYLKIYLTQEPVDEVIIGMPQTLRAQDSSLAPAVRTFIAVFQRQFTVPVIPCDERFTSVIARQTMLQGGLPKKKRQNKGAVDQISATILLQDYLRGRSKMPLLNR